MKAPQLNASTQNQRYVSATLSLACEWLGEIDIVLAAVASSLEANGASYTAEGNAGAGFQKYRLGYAGRGWGWLTVAGTTVEVSYGFEAHSDEQAAEAQASAVETLTSAGNAASVAASAAFPFLRGVERMIRAAEAKSAASRHLAIEALEEAAERTSARAEQLERIAREHAEALTTAPDSVLFADLDDHVNRLEAGLDSLTNQIDDHRGENRAEIEALTARANALFMAIGVHGSRIEAFDNRIAELTRRLDEADARRPGLATQSQALKSENGLEALNRRLEKLGEIVGAVSERTERLRFDKDLIERVEHGLNEQIQALREQLDAQRGHEPAAGTSNDGARAVHPVTDERGPWAPAERRFERCAYYRCSNFFTADNAVVWQWRIPAGTPMGTYIPAYAYCTEAHAEADRDHEIHESGHRRDGEILDP